MSFTRPLLRLALVLGLALLPGLAGLAQGPSGPAPKPASVNATNLPPLREVSPGIYEIGQVRLNRERKAVTFPASINLLDGPIEYWLVGSAGKVHESLLKTDAEPYHIHVAMLFLGAQGAPPRNPEEPGDIHSLRGDKISVWVSWTTPKGLERHRAEELILNTETHKVMSQGDWTYNGSWIFDGNFVAQRERSVVAIISDADALVNNPRPGRENDDIWRVRKEIAPPAGTPVEVTLQLEKPAPRPKKS
jgi:hypothetical protein